MDEEALAKHLHAGHIRAALDVYESEPLPIDSPLRNMDNVYLFPHIAGPTPDHRRFCAQIVLEDIERLQKGEPLHNEITRIRATQMTR